MEQRIMAAYRFLLEWLHTNVLTVNTAIQWACVVGAFVLTALIWRSQERKLFQWIGDRVEGETLRSILRAVVDTGNVVGFVLTMQVCAAIFDNFDMGPRVLLAASDLGMAWILARLATSILPNRALAKLVVMGVWIVAALAVFDLLKPITDFLQELKYSIGETSFTALGAIKGLITAGILLQAASLTAQFAVRRIDRATTLSPSLRVLITKTVRVLLYAAAILFAMSSVGIDLTSLAIFSSALGVGIGFGLKTVFSNYVAGILLLVDDSIKPGDTIEIGSVYGVVRDMRGRYTSVLTRDGTEYLIPNEQLITGEVVNWSYSDSNVRLKIPVGIAYESDVEKALEILGTAADGVTRVLRNPAPAPRLVGFGDSSVDLELRLWIADADKGVVNVRSEVLLNIWKLFHEHGIEFPFPQRDVLLKPDSALSVTLNKEEAMRDGLSIRTMTRDDVDFAIRLANREGWNPGLSDADCFYAADPEGFFIAEINGTPAGTISAVRYDGDFGFLGLYIMTREERGKGYGMELWQHALKHLDGCTIGLDAVPEQEETYVRSGFEPRYRSVRFEGKGGGTTPEGVTPLTGIPLKAVLKYDRQCFPGGRESFMRAWIDAIGVKGYGVVKDGELAGFGVIRPCAMGYKIGPLFADDPATAEKLYTALAAYVPGERLFLDVIEPNEAGMELVKRHDLEEVFATVRMYVGDAPDMDLEKIYGVTSFELG